MIDRDNPRCASSRRRHRPAFAAAVRRAHRGHAARSTGAADDRVLPAHRHGACATACWRSPATARSRVINDEAYRIFGAHAQRRRHRPAVRRACCSDHPDMVRVLAERVRADQLPNRAELRLKPRQGHRLHAVARPRRRGRVIGAAMFFKDLTRVEQLEERERLRDRLAALGEMAAGIAHEVKNPLAGIEVMAGLLRRKVPRRRPTRSRCSTDIISEAKMANAIVRKCSSSCGRSGCRSSATAVARRASRTRSSWPKRKARARRASTCSCRVPRRPAADPGRPASAAQVFTNLLINAYEALDGRGRVDDHAPMRLEEDPHVGRRRPTRRRARARSPTTARACRRTSRDRDLQPVLHDQAAGLGPRAGHRPEDRRRARRPNRLQQRAGRARASG